MTSFQDARAFLLEHRTDYDAAVKGFRWPDPVPFNWALDWFDAELATDVESRDRPALWIVDQGKETRLSFAELSRRSNQVANFLRAQGIERGDHLLLLLGNVVPLWETMLAAIKLGVVVIPATTLLTADELQDRLDRGRAKLVVAAQDQVAKFAKLKSDNLARIVVGATSAHEGWLPFEQASGASEAFVPDGPTGADDPMLLYFTSGTTAKPKLVRHSQRSYPVGALSTMFWLGLKPGDIHLNISSPGWAKHAWSCFFAPWNAGATVFVYAASRFNAKETLSAIAHHGVTTLCAPPTVWRLFVQEDLSAFPLRLRATASAGEPLNPEIIETIRAAWNLEIRDGYGQTETTAQIGNPPGQPLKPGSMGRPLPGYRVALLDAEDREAEEGEVALDLRASPLGLMLGYEEEASLKSAAQGGYYRTGDVAVRDAEGYITFVGRADDVFKAADYRISPFELESLLIEHDAVAEAAVVPSPDAIRLAVPKAYVVLARGWEPSAETARVIYIHIREHMSAFKRVRRLEFAELPKTISGKIRRVDLRRRESERHGTGASASAPRAPNEYWAEDFPELK